MSLSSTNTSLKSSGTFNSNSSISSTPSADRYAALKDLDEQLREIKEKETFNTQLSSSPSVTVNPFKQALAASQNPQTSNPFQTQQQNGWAQSDPFAPVTNGIGSGNLYSSPTFGLNGNKGFANGMQAYQQQQSPQQSYQKNGNAFMNGNGLGIQQNGGFLPKNGFGVSFIDFCIEKFLES